MNLVLGSGHLDAILQHMKAGLPQEACGLLAGDANGVTRFIPIANRLKSETAYDMEPSALIAALRSLRESGERLAAICHSHPKGPAWPSPRDIEGAYYPEAVHVIVSLASADNPVVRGFRIVDGEVFEVELHVIV